MAAWQDNEATVKLLTIEGKAQLEARDEKGQTPLHLAAWEGQTNTAKTLLALGANKEAKDNDQCTPLHLAAWQGNLATVKELVSQGANIKAKDKRGRTPADWARSEKHPPILNYLNKANKRGRRH